MTIVGRRQSVTATAAVQKSKSAVPIFLQDYYECLKERGRNGIGLGKCLTFTGKPRLGSLVPSFTSNNNVLLSIVYIHLEHLHPAFFGISGTVRHIASLSAHLFVRNFLLVVWNGRNEKLNLFRMEMCLGLRHRTINVYGIKFSGIQD